MTQPKRDSATRAPKRILSEASLRAIVLPRRRGGTRERGEVSPALFEVLVLVERRARRRKEDRVAGSCDLSRTRDRLLHRETSLEVRLAGERGFDRSRGFADREHHSRALADEIRERREVAVLVATPQDQYHASIRVSLE